MALFVDKEATKKAKEQYEEIDNKISTFLSQLSQTLANSESEKQKELLQAIYANVQEMSIIIKDRGVQRALDHKTPRAGDEVLFKDAANVLTSLFEGITKPTVLSESQFLSTANHFNNHHKTKEQDNNLFVARALTCAAVVGFLCGLALLPTPLAPLGIVFCAINVFSIANAWDSYNQIKKHDKSTDNQINTMEKILSNTETTKIYKELIEQQRPPEKEAPHNNADTTNTIYPGANT